MSSSETETSGTSSEEEGGDQTTLVGRIGEPSSSRMRSSDGVWPEPFVEAVAAKVAIDAAAENRRLAAAPALAAVFQVCSTWRAVSRSELLWQNLTRQIWGCHRRIHATWHDEYVYRHRAAHNFRIGRAVYTPLVFEASSPSVANDSLSCRRVAISDRHLACGFLDGSVRVFDLPSLRHVSILRPHRRDHLGRFSPAVSGIVLHDSRVVFASLVGDIHVAAARGPRARRAHEGDVVSDGALVDFTGCNRWWVGLYAGVPGRAFHVWNGDTEELVFVGGSLTDPEAVLGWHLLSDELPDSVGRVRVSSQDTGVACTGRCIMVFDLNNQGLVLGEEEFQRRIVVDSVDVSNERFLVIDNRGVARVRLVHTFEEICRFAVRRGGAQHQHQRIHGCMNAGYALVCVGGIIRVWDVDTGHNLYSLRERVGPANDLVANEVHVAGCSPETGIHVWSFSAA